MHTVWFGLSYLCIIVCIMCVSDLHRFCTIDIIISSTCSNVNLILFYCFSPQIWHHGPHDQVIHGHGYYLMIPSLSRLSIIWPDWVPYIILNALSILPDYIYICIITMIQFSLPTGWNQFLGFTRWSIINTFFPNVSIWCITLTFLSSAIMRNMYPWVHCTSYEH